MILSTQPIFWVKTFLIVCYLRGGDDDNDGDEDDDDSTCDDDDDELEKCIWWSAFNGDISFAHTGDAGDIFFIVGSTTLYVIYQHVPFCIISYSYFACTILHLSQNI